MYLFVFLGSSTCVTLFLLVECSLVFFPRSPPRVLHVPRRDSLQNVKDRPLGFYPTPRVLLCFGYIGTVRHHHHCAHLRKGLIIAKDGNFDDIFVIPCNCIDTHMALLLCSLPIETSH